MPITLDGRERAREPLRIAIVVAIEADRPRVRFNSSRPDNEARMRDWLARRPDLAALVDRALELRDAA